MGLAEDHFSALRAAYKEHCRPQGPQRQGPIRDIYPCGGSGGRADKAQEGESSAAESDANDRTALESTSSQGYHGDMGNADDDPQWQGDIEEKHAEGQHQTQGKRRRPSRGAAGASDSSYPRPREGV
jgi:hypothetical protein